MAKDNHNELYINIDTSEIEKVQRRLAHIKGGAETAIQRAINVAVVGIRTDGAREVSKEFMVSKQAVREKMVVIKASRANLDAVAKRKGPRFFAKNFPRTPNTNPGQRGGKPVFLRPHRSGDGWHLRSDASRGKSGVSKAFVVRDRHGKMKRGPGIYVRIGNRRNRLAHARGLSVPEMLGNSRIRETIQAGATMRLNKELDRQVNLILSKEAKR